MYQKQKQFETGSLKSEIKSEKNFFREIGLLKKKQSEIRKMETVNPGSQELAEKAHRSAIEHLISEYGHHMAESQVYELEHSGTERQIQVLSISEYKKLFPKKDIEVAGHCSESGNIYVKDISPEMVKHVSVHETLYRCANRTWSKDENGNKKTTCGFRESIKYADGIQVIKDRAANKGITEVYTLRELRRQGEEEPMSSDIIYSEARIWMERIEALVGKETMAEAYFGKGKKEFEETFQHLNNGNGMAWEIFSKDLDVINSKAVSSVKEYANKRLEDIYYAMLQNKEEE